MTKATKTETFDNVTIHLMVRDEMPSVYFALLSVLPYVNHAIIADTGSCDGTLEHLYMIKAAFPQKKIIIHAEQLKDSTGWSFHRYIEPNVELARCRQQMIEETQTDYFWIVDGDEVYSDAAALAAIHAFQNWQSGTLCCYVPLLWFAHDINTLVTRCSPGTYPFTGRLFVTKGTHLTGVFRERCTSIKATI